MFRPWTAIGLCLWLSGTGFVWAQEVSLPATLQPTIFVNVHISTWKTRGRLLYDFEGTILKKVLLAGFQPVREVTNPHEYELTVLYREERGEQYAVDAWGTIMRGEFRFSGLTLPQAVAWNVEVSSENSLSGSPPYLDALLKFETDPLYFFLGDLLMYMAKNSGKIHEGLKVVLEQRVTSAYAPSHSAGVSDRATTQDHFMDPSYIVFQDQAFQRTIEELGRQGYSAHDLVPIARHTVRSPARELRLQAVTILANAEDLDSCSSFQRLARKDPDRKIRKRAWEFLRNCSVPPVE